jgi:enoyl-CoA hydratase/carnithine racemase
MQAMSGQAYPDLLDLDLSGPVGRVTLARPAKRNALSDSLVRALRDVFETLPAHVNAVVLDAQGPHFCAGLDLSEMEDHDVPGGVLHSRMWHAAFERIQFGRVPVVSVLRGAVVGGGLELACSTHVRIAEDSTFYALPEGTRGLFVGGGGSVRIPRVIGVPRMTDMMLTGRVLTADEGERAGLSQYRVAEGEGLAKALALAERIAQNAPVSNFAILQALPRIANQSMEDGFLMEALMAGISQGEPAAKARMQDFLRNKANKVKPGGAA